MDKRNRSTQNWSSFPLSHLSHWSTLLTWQQPRGLFFQLCCIFFLNTLCYVLVIMETSIFMLGTIFQYFIFTLTHFISYIFHVNTISREQGLVYMFHYYIECLREPFKNWSIFWIQRCNITFHHHSIFMWHIQLFWTTVMKDYENPQFAKLHMIQLS